MGRAARDNNRSGGHSPRDDRMRIDFILGSKSSGSSSDSTNASTPQSPARHAAGRAGLGHSDNAAIHSTHRAYYAERDRDKDRDRDRDHDRRVFELMDAEELQPAGRGSLAARRKSFVLSITKTCSRRGYVVCRLCNEYIWGPNGKYHVEKCPTLSRARDKARREGVVLQSIAGIAIDHEVLNEIKSSRPRQSSVEGFVMSQSVAVDDPNLAPSVEERRAGAAVGKKGYIRCLVCNHEVYAPNARHHKVVCPGWRRNFGRT